MMITQPHCTEYDFSFLSEVLGFKVSGVRDKIIGKKILLVDDVYTTGATVDECARLLLHHGAAHVDVLSLARAI